MTRQLDRIARNIVKRRARMWFVRNGQFVQEVPTLDEARGLAATTLLLIDIANGRDDDTQRKLVTDDAR